MQDETYNGWKNYPTWAVNLWLTNDQGSDEMCREMALEAHETSHHPRFTLADGLKILVHEENEPDDASLASDLLGYAFDCVDWYEIADAFLDEVGVPA